MNSGYNMNNNWNMNNMNFEDGEPVHVVGAGGRRLLGREVGGGAELGGDVATLRLPVAHLVADAHDGEGDGAPERGHQQHDPPRTLAGDEEGERVGGEEREPEQDVGGEGVNVGHLGEHDGPEDQHQIDPRQLEEE